MNRENIGTFFIKSMIASIFILLVLLIWNYGLDPLLKPKDREEIITNKCYLNRKASLYLGSWEGNLDMKIKGIYINDKDIYIDTILENKTPNILKIDNYGLVNIDNKYNLPFLGSPSSNIVKPKDTINYVFKVKISNLDPEKCNPNNFKFQVGGSEKYLFAFDVAWN